MSAGDLLGYVCCGCGEQFPEDVGRHGRADHHPACDGDDCGKYGCPVEVQCGPIEAEYEADEKASEPFTQPEIGELPF